MSDNYWFVEEESDLDTLREIVENPGGYGYMENKVETLCEQIRCISKYLIKLSKKHEKDYKNLEETD